MGADRNGRRVYGLPDIRRYLRVGVVRMKPVQPGVIGVLTHMRKNKKLSRQKIADASGYSLRALSSWERGERDPTHDALTKWAACFGCEVALRPIDRKDG